MQSPELETAQTGRGSNAVTRRDSRARFFPRMSSRRSDDARDELPKGFDRGPVRHLTWADTVDLRPSGW